MKLAADQLIQNRYRLVRLIGDGGMGSVYEARHEVLGSTVAIKFLHPKLAVRPALVQRFLQEARVSAQIKSDHVVRVTDVEQSADGLVYMVMEYVHGRTLQTLYEDLYNSRGQLFYRDALVYAVQILQGVHAAHSAQVVHRDLKPDNVMLTKNERGEEIVKLLDFGIAKLKITGEFRPGTRPGIVMGTPEYMAPEQADSAHQADVSADIFSVGVMLFEMLAGRRPVAGADPFQISSAYRAGEVAQLRSLAPHIPEALADLVHRAIAPQPEHRPASAEAFRSALLPFVEAAFREVPVPPGRLSALPPQVIAHPLQPAFADPVTPLPNHLVSRPASGPSRQPSAAGAAPDAQSGSSPAPGRPSKTLDDEPKAHASSAPGPHAVSQPYAPQPHAPQPYAPQPYAPHASQPYASQPAAGAGVPGGPVVQPLAAPPARAARRGGSPWLWAVLIGAVVSGLVVLAVYVALSDHEVGQNTGAGKGTSTARASSSPSAAGSSAPSAQPAPRVTAAASASATPPAPTPTPSAKPPPTGTQPKPKPPPTTEPGSPIGLCPGPLGFPIPCAGGGGTDPEPTEPSPRPQPTRIPIPVPE
jgi:serine/threonine protein kinase